MLPDSDLLYKVALSLIPGVGNTIARNLVAYVGSLEQLFFKPKSFLKTIPGVGDKIAESIIQSGVLKDAEAEIEFIQKHNIKVTSFLDKDYPILLKQCADAPILLYSKGINFLRFDKTLAIVGTRDNTSYGQYFLEQFMEELADKHPDVLIVSGLAYGIDILAHKYALKNKLATAAVLGHGLDRIYPQVHLKTAKEIVTNGTLITEFPSGTNPDRPNFVKRNRIVAGMCEGTLIVESAAKGGSLITAELAFSYDREVMALPGRIDAPFSAGCNQLIKSNRASLISSVEDVELTLGWQRGATVNVPKKVPPVLNEDEKLVYKTIKSEEKVNLNELCRLTRKPIHELNGTLFQMEFRGIVRQLPGNVFEVIA